MHFRRNVLQPTLAFLKRNAPDPLPIRQSFKTYNAKKLGADLKAALNVALLTLPQGMAYAAIAELPIYYGILCSIIAGLIAPLFSSARHTILGPTNATAFMVFSFFVTHPEVDPATKLSLIPLLVLMVGVISLIGAFARIADLLQFISRSVLVGYITGAAILIIANQTKHALGIAAPINAASAKSFFEILAATAELWGHYQWPPIAIAGFTLLTYLILQKKFKLLPNFALTLTLSAVVTYYLRLHVPAFAGIETFAPFEDLNFAPQLPHITLDNINFLLPAAFAIAFLTALETNVMGKSLGSLSGDRTDSNQDMYASGMANVAASLITPMPASASLTRSALNYDSGAKTRFASIFCSLLSLAGFFALLRLPIVEHIPKTSLAALVIGIAISLIRWKNIRICLRSTNSDAFVIIITLAATLLTRLDYAIFLGVGISIALFLRKASHPHLVEYEITDQGNLRALDESKARPLPAISIVHVEGDLFFGAAELFRTQIQRTASDPSLKAIVLRLKNARHLDATSVMALDEMVKQLHRSGRHVLISGATRSVYRVLKRSGVIETIQKGCDRTQGETNIFFTLSSNPNLSTRDALIRAQELIGTDKADIKIFYDPNKDK